MFNVRNIPVDHKDLIHDVAYDFHGQRMATCSTDQCVKVWDLGEDLEWHCTASLKSHSGSVWRVTWAHPEFGQVIAACSFDRTATVWEEIVGDGGTNGKTHWIRKSSLVDSRTSVTDVRFAPKHLGLQLATCSADGIVRIYEAPDVMNLSQWSLQFDINCKLTCSCLSWNPSRAHPPMIAVGSDDANPAAGGKVHVYEYNDNTRKWAKAETISSVTEPVHDIAFAPNLGRTYHLLAIASKDLKIVTLKPLRRDSALTGNAGVTKLEMKLVGQFEEHESQVWRVCWNVTGTVLASSGDDGKVRIWKANYLNSWKCIQVLKGSGSQPSVDRGVSTPGSAGQASANSISTSPPPGSMNIKRNSGWPYMTTAKDQSKFYY